MTKDELGRLYGIGSLLCMVLCVIGFFMLRGPNSNVYLIIGIGAIVSLIGISLAYASWVYTKRFFYLIIGLLGNSAVLAFSSLLLLAMGISKP